MRGYFTVVMGVAAITATYGNVIDISTGQGHGAWQFLDPALGFVPATPLTVAQQNGFWALAPQGSGWVSYGSIQGTTCGPGQTPGIGCANALTNPSGDLLEYILTIPAANLNATTGTANFIFGSDNRVSVFVGMNSLGQFWDSASGPGIGFNPLGCSGLPAATSAGSSQATYNNCSGTVSFNASNLNGDGSLTITAFSYNDPVINCPTCGDPTGFVLQGKLLSGSSAVPEPSTFVLVALAGIAGLARRRWGKL